MILSADNNWAIGLNNKLLVSIPADMKFFRQTTTGNVVVMGRKTLESFPGGQPLKNRTNIVLSTNPDYQVKGAIVVHSKEELLKELEKYDSDSIYVIGGATIYKMMLPYQITIHVTKSTMRMRQTPFLSTWMKCRSGKSPQTAMSRPISTWNMSS